MVFCGFGCCAKEGKKEIPLHLLKLPQGFEIHVFYGKVPGARSLAIGEKGTVFVGTRDEGIVYALKDEDQDGVADLLYLLAGDLNMPNGVAFKDGALYVAEINRIIRFENIEDFLDDPPDPVIVNDSFPNERRHGWKFIAFGPDDMLYVPVGMPCNICLPDEEIFGTITRMKPDGSELEVFASGIRNTVGFDWHPDSDELWFTDNGADWMGDNRPADELNRASKPGMHFGFPFYHASISDENYKKKREVKEFYTFPVQELGPHVAALGMRFYTGAMFPKKYKGQIFIAEHGSWNRSVPIGYRIMLVRLEDQTPISLEVFCEGWLQGIKDWGRPVDVQVMKDGSLLISDDKMGAVYRIVWTGNG